MPTLTFIVLKFEKKNRCKKSTKCLRKANEVKDWEYIGFSTGDDVISVLLWLLFGYYKDGILL